MIERIAAETPANISLLERGALQSTAGANLDDRLRDVPGFSLFRRFSSLTAHPTTQGVSLRGVGPSGASRTLVLWDGVPANDPFGGWVYWTRFPPDELERVEIARGASTSVFGDRAMGGIVALVSREAEPLRLSGSYLGGNRDSHEVSAGFSHAWSRWAASARSRSFTSGGYFIVPAAHRGAIDREARLRFVTADTRLDFFRGLDRFFVKLDLLAEERHNGTVLQRNSTSLGSVTGHYAREGARDGISLLGWHTRQEFRSSFSAIAADRNSERLTANQTVPAENAGAAALWNRRGGPVRWLAGADVVRTEGYSKEALFPSGQRVGGGTLLQHGAFAQTEASLGGVKMFLGGRHDFTGQDRQFFSPSAGAVAGRGPLRARGSVYRAFRAPTLNELFREFRVGNAVTQANPALKPERLLGAEAGFDVVGEGMRGSVTFYRSSLSDLVTNVTLSAAPNLIVRQRQNAAAAVSRGIEVDARGRRGRLVGEGSYLFVDSRFRSGARIPQVPRHQGSARLTWTGGGTLFSFAARSFASQFEDERNLRDFLLPGYASLQLMARRQLTANLSAVLSVDNLLDRAYLAGLTPAPTLGPPRLWRAGLRWDGRLR